MNKPIESIGSHHYLLYGLIGIPLTFGALPLYMHIPKFYAEASLLSLSLIGFILSGVRVLDALSDPFFGRLADRINRRYLMSLSLGVFVVSFVAICHPPANMNSLQMSIWLCVSLSLTGISLSAASIAFHAWGASLGANPQQRSLLVVSREMLTLMALIMAAALPVLISPNISEGVKSLSYVLLVLGVICVGLAFLLPLPKLQTLNPKSFAGFSFIGYLKDLYQQLSILWQSPTSRWLLIIFMLNGVASAIPATLFFFFVEDVLDAKDRSGVFLAIYFLSGALFMPVWNLAAKRFGRIQTWQASMVLAVLSFLLAGFLDQGDINAFYLVCFASGLALGADLCLPASMAADYGEKEQKTGILFGWWNLITKLNLALASGIALPILALFGYETGAGQNNAAALKITYVALPIAIKLATLALLSKGFSLFKSINYVTNGATHEAS